MKKYFKEFITIVLVVFLASNVIGYFRSSSVQVDGNLEALKSALTISGQKVGSLIKPDKPLVINFWGTWCPVCAREVYNISSLSKSKDFTLITVAVNSGSDEEIKKYMQEKGIDFTVVNDKNDALANRFKITTYPTTVFISSSGKKIIKDSGYLTKPGFLARVKMVEN